MEGIFNIYLSARYWHISLLGGWISHGTPQEYPDVPTKRSPFTQHFLALTAYFDKDFKQKWW